MRIWVDADACPAPIKEIIVKAAINRSVFTIFVANKAIQLQASPYLTSVQVESGIDIADQYIEEQAREGDMAITQDIPLASKLVSKKVIVMSVHGTWFTPNNIAERLSIRNFLQDIRDSGGHTKGPKPFSPKDKQKFAQIFDQQLTKLLKMNRQ